MRRLARQSGALATFALLLSVLGPPDADAAETKLVAKCQDVEKAAGSGSASPFPSGTSTATLTCDVRAAGFAVFKDMKAKIKGKGDELETKFEAFDPAEHGTTTSYLIQVLPNARRATLTQMGDAVVTFADQRGGKRRFTAYSFANELTLISDSGASKAEFVRQVIGVKPAAATIQLYKTTMQAIEALAKESGDRKALVILADGTSDDTGYTHDQVVKAAKDAGITIHGLGYYDDKGERPKFQKLSRLAEDTGGYATEVKQGSGKDFSKDIVTSRFVGEVLENGGTLKTALKGPSGAATVEFTANFSDGQSSTAEQKVDIPAAPPPPSGFDTPSGERRVDTEPPPPAGFFDGIADWFEDNSILAMVLGALIGIGAVSYAMYTRNQAAMSGQDGAGPGEPLLDANGQPVVYGWLEMLDGNASRHPLRTTNVRVGRHRDNDICLQNDSISRRHAVLHYNADTRRFIITDLGGGNGVVVNKTKYKTRELNDGDMVELGEVRLRFRAETEFLA